MTTECLIHELEAAHRIIRNALNLMTTEQKVAWWHMNERDGVDGEGITRANEREEVIALAKALDEFSTPSPERRRVVSRRTAT